MIPDLRAAGRLVTRTAADGSSVEVVEREFALRSYDPETRTGEIIASDATVDRYGDIVEASGWRLENYRRNPVMLIDHSYSVNDIVGQAFPRIEGGALVARFVLDDPATNRQASIVASLIKNRSLRAVSVGFTAKAYEPILDDDGNWTGGFRFTDQELLEISWVAVPANPSAVMSINDPEPTAASSDEADPVLIAARAMAFASERVRA